MKKYYINTLVLFAALPSVSFAALGGVTSLLKDIQTILGSLVPIVFGLCMVYFFWGLAQFISNAGDSKTRDDGKKKILWGIIALFVFVAVYGILNTISDLTGIKQTPSPCGVTLTGTGLSGC